MPADEFVKLVSSPQVLGDPSLKTQHFVGASKWERISADEVVGYHQLRVPHQKKTTTTVEVEKSKAESNGMRRFWFYKDVCKILHERLEIHDHN